MQIINCFGNYHLETLYSRIHQVLLRRFPAQRSSVLNQGVPGRCNQFQLVANNLMKKSTKKKPLLFYNNSSALISNLTYY